MPEVANFSTSRAGGESLADTGTAATFGAGTAAGILEVSAEATLPKPTLVATASVKVIKFKVFITRLSVLLLIQYNTYLYDPARQRKVPLNRKINYRLQNPASSAAVAIYALNKGNFQPRC